MLGMIEAKRLGKGVDNVLEQTKRYSKGVENTIGQWREYKVPFPYSSNGKIIYFPDVRRKKNTSYRIGDLHTPGALSDMCSRNTDEAEQWFSEKYRPSHKIPEQYFSIINEEMKQNRGPVGTLAEGAVASIWCNGV